MSDAEAIEDLTEDEESGDIHRAQKTPIACIRLDLRYPMLLDQEKQATTRDSWDAIRSAKRALFQASQIVIGDITIHVRNLRAAGKTRYPTSTERLYFKEKGVPYPTECYTDEDIFKIRNIITDGIKKAGLSEYVYSSVAEKLRSSEFAGEKLNALLRGDAAYPVIRNLGIMIRNRNWRLTVEEVQRNGKTYYNPVIEMSAIKPGLGKIKLVCDGLHGKAAVSRIPVLQRLTRLGFKSTGEAADMEGWKKGALTLRSLKRPGEPEKWEILLPYYAPQAAKEDQEAIVVAHRGVANMLTVAIATGDDVKYATYPGTNIVHHKAQFFARRRQMNRDLAAAPHRGKGRKAHFKALGKLANKEARCVDTEIWRVAKFLQTKVEQYNAKLVVLDDFGTFYSDNPSSDYLQPYIRRFPFGAVKQRIIDACTRRAATPVCEQSIKYKSQTCPACGHTDKANVARPPRVSGTSSQDGRFECGKCRLGLDLDRVAVLNMLLASEHVSEKTKKAVIASLENLKRYVGKIREARAEEARV